MKERSMHSDAILGKDEFVRELLFISSYADLLRDAAPTREISEAQDFFGLREINLWVLLSQIAMLRAAARDDDVKKADIDAAACFDSVANAGNKHVAQQLFFISLYLYMTERATDDADVLAALKTLDIDEMHFRFMYKSTAFSSERGDEMGLRTAVACARAVFVERNKSAQRQCE
jgi:hypothetical protein